MRFFYTYLVEIRIFSELLLVAVCIWLCNERRKALSETALLSQAGRNFLRGMPVQGLSGVRTSHGRSLLRLLQVSRLRAKRLELTEESEIDFKLVEHGGLEKLAESLVSAMSDYLVVKPLAIRVLIKNQGRLSLLAKFGPDSARFGRIVSDIVSDLDFIDQSLCEIAAEDKVLRTFGIARQLAFKLSLREYEMDSEVICWLGFKESLSSSYQFEKATLVSLVKKSKLLVSQFLRITNLEKELGDERDNFVGISHDLKAPGITALYLIRELLASKSQEEQHRFIDLELLMLEQLSLIQDFLDLERSRVSSIRVDPKEVNLTKFVEQIGASPIVRYQRHGINFRIDSSSHLVAVFDHNHLKRVVLNLLSNAFKYTESGDVVLGIKQNNAEIELFVSDTGPGIAKDLQQSLFQKFERLDAPDHISGSGIGLSASKLLAKKNGSELRYAQAAGGGSIFSLVLPSRSVVSSDKPHQGAVPARARGTVLVVEDDEATCRLYSRILAANGFDSEVRANIREAWSSIESGKRYEALICDFKLPDGESFSLLKEISVRGMLSPTLVITGMTEWSKQQSQTREVMERVFSVRFLEKPVEREEFEQALFETMERFNQLVIEQSNAVVHL